MKFVAITILIALFAYTLSASNGEYDPDKWCGSSIINVSIKTIDSGKELITKAKILVPVNLEKAQLFMQGDKDKQMFMKGDKLIKKNQEGIIFTVDGPMEKAHLGVIYQRDEDSEKDIYIPYSFITLINESIIAGDPTVYQIKLFLGKDFKNNSLKNSYEVIISFDADEYKTTICECMFKYFIAKLRYNWELRKGSLEYIRAELFKFIRSYYINLKDIEKIAKQGLEHQEGMKLLETFKLDYTKIVDKCSSMKIKIDQFLREVNQVDLRIRNFPIIDCTPILREIKVFEEKIKASQKQQTTELSKLRLNKGADPANQIQEVINLDRSQIINSFDDMSKFTEILNETQKKTFTQEQTTWKTETRFVPTKTMTRDIEMTNLNAVKKVVETTESFFTSIKLD